ncbi:hypothetical protein [Tellurirhabdus bombi]|uniref:hypothetical protein n=1 Tax=Tellurirhabdus bombi TaxID=2907205 RepID=UPI001F2B59D3|nr:hypothetical protein [Tellurirhabdus bombi]
MQKRYTLLLPTIGVFLILLLSCKKEKEEAIQPLFNPAYLLGNWTTIPNGQPYLRWTLDEKMWSETLVPSTSCEPVNSFMTLPYAVKNDTLDIYWGIPKEAQDNFYLIRSLTPTRMVLYRTHYKNEAIFEKCQ